jgi:WD40 repeat protein
VRDESIRALERAAAQGDAMAAAQLLAFWIRAGRRLCGVTRGTTWALVDAATGEVLRTHGKHRRAISHISFSRDGTLCLTSSLDGTAKLWDVALGCELAVFKGRAGVTSAAFTPDAKRAVTSSLDLTVKVWDIAKRAVVLERRHHDLAVFALAVSPDGGLLLSGSEDGAIGALDLVTGDLRWLRGHRGGVSAITFSPDGALAASGSWDETVRVWDVASGREHRTLRGHRGPVESVAFLPRGRLVTAGRDRTIRVFDLSTSNLLRTIEDEQRWVGSLALAADGRTLLAGGERAVKLWDVEKGETIRTFPGRWPDSSVAWLPVD